MYALRNSIQAVAGVYGTSVLPMYSLLCQIGAWPHCGAFVCLRASRLRLRAASSADGRPSKASPSREILRYLLSWGVWANNVCELDGDGPQVKGSRFHSPWSAETDDLSEVIDPTWAVMTRETGPSSMQSEMACSLPNAGPFIHIGPSAPVPAPRRAAEALLPARWKHDTRHALQDDGRAAGYKLRCAA